MAHRPMSTQKCDNGGGLNQKSASGKIKKWLEKLFFAEVRAVNSRKWLIVCLAGVNLALGAALAFRLMPMPAAQAQARGHAVGTFHAVSGVDNGQGGVVYVMDTNTGILSGIVTPQTGRASFLPPHSVYADIKRVSRRMR